MPKVVVKRDGKRWAIYVDGRLIEGGFFDREAAIRTASEYSRKEST